MAQKKFKTVDAFIKHVGRSRFETELGHKPQVVSRAISDDVMPAHWFFDIRDFCAEIGVPVPEHLFRRSHRPRHATHVAKPQSAA